MRAVLVVAKDSIDLIGRMLNKNNVEVVGMVVDDRPFIIEHGCPKNRAFAFWQLKDAVELTSPDYVLFFLPRQTPVNSFHAQLKEAKFPLDKTCMMYNFSDDEVLTHQRMIRGFQKDSQQYKIIAAGNSGIYFGISPEEFELPVWNFAYYSQDLYYDYQIIKRALPRVKEYYKRFNHDKVNELLDFLNDLSCDYRFTFVNFWAMKDMFNDYDFHDIYHLNQKGSKKFSAFLNHIVMEMEGVK